jgi:hypothetical protein
MPATFEVLDGFALPSRRAYVFRGSVLDGEVRAGMFLLIPLNPALDVVLPILAVEAVAAPGGQGPVGLLVDYEDDVGLAMWQGFTAPGERLKVAGRDPTA